MNQSDDHRTTTHVSARQSGQMAVAAAYRVEVMVGEVSAPEVLDSPAAAIWATICPNGSTTAPSPRR